MIELVFVACLRLHPSECEEWSLVGTPEASAAACMIQAQPQLAEWAQTHPGFTIARWTCRDVSRREIRA